MKQECIPILLLTKDIKNVLWLTNKMIFSNTDISVNTSISQHLYICSKKEIKEGDYVCNEKALPLGIAVIEITKENIKWAKEHFIPKIIATTDLALVNTFMTCPTGKYHEDKPILRQGDYTQSPIYTISPSFTQLYIEKYNKGEKIEKCMVEYETKLTSEDKRLSITTDFKEKIPEGLGRQLNKYSFSGKYTPKLNGNEIIISECEEKLYTRKEVIFLIREFDMTKGRDITTKDFDDWISKNL